jgi:DNA-binding CsgD family transcriptional regulator
MTQTDALIEQLSRRELEILALLAQHYTNKEIASNLNLSVNSVKWYARQIYGKLGIENRRQVAARASELGLLSKTVGDKTSPNSAIGTVAPFSTNLADKPRHNLPLQLTSFIGREVKIEKI